MLPHSTSTPESRTPRVIPAKAGIQREDCGATCTSWIPAFAGMTSGAIVAALLFVAAGAFAVDETPAQVLCVRNRALIPVSINDVKPYYMLLDLALPRPVHLSSPPCLPRVFSIQYSVRPDPCDD